MENLSLLLQQREETALKWVILINCTPYMFEEVLSILFCIFVGNTGEEKASHWSSSLKIAMLFYYTNSFCSYKVMCEWAYSLSYRICISSESCICKAYLFLNFIQNSSLYLIQPSESFALCWSACWTTYLFLGIKKVWGFEQSAV